MKMKEIDYIASLLQNGGIPLSCLAEGYKNYIKSVKIISDKIIQLNMVKGTVVLTIRYGMSK